MLREMLHCLEHGYSAMAFSKKLLAEKEVTYYFIIWHSHNIRLVNIMKHFPLKQFFVIFQIKIIIAWEIVRIIWLQ